MKIILFLSLLSSTVFGLNPLAKGIKPGSCIESRFMDYKIVKLMRKEHGLYVYEAVGLPEISAHGIVKTKHKFTSPGYAGLNLQYVNSIPVQADNGFEVLVDVWIDCPIKKESK